GDDRRARTVLPRERPDRPPGAAGDRRPSRGRPAAHGQRGRGALGGPAHRCHRHRELDPLPRELCMTHRPGETVNARILSPIISPRVTPCPLFAVDVAVDSVFAAARGRMLDLARNYPVDRLLAVFRATTLLAPPAARSPGTWKVLGHSQEDACSEHDYPGREEAQTANLLRGHSAGHFLSMLSLAHAATGEEAFKDKVTDFVAGLGQVQDALAATGRYSHPGFLAAYGEW